MAAENKGVSRRDFITKVMWGSLLSFYGLTRLPNVMAGEESLKKGLEQISESSVSSAGDEIINKKRKEIYGVVKEHGEKSYVLSFIGSQYTQRPSETEPFVSGYGGAELDGLVAGPSGHYKINPSGGFEWAPDGNADICFGEIRIEKGKNLVEIIAENGSKIAIVPQEHQDESVPELEKSSWQSQILFDIGIFNYPAFHKNPMFILQRNNQDGSYTYIKGQLWYIPPCIGIKSVENVAKNLETLFTIEGSHPYTK